MKEKRKYPAKLLLFGEYTVLTGSQSLALPFHKYQLSLTKTRLNNFSGIIKSIYTYLKNLTFDQYNYSFDADLYRSLFENGFNIQSDIPIGYGVGSSGAFTAMVFDRFFMPEENNTEINNWDLKNILAEIEGFFHGKSSGVDPLISFLDKAVITDIGGNIDFYEFSPVIFKPFHLFLIDSGIARSTAKYVELFKSRISDPIYYKEQILPLTETNNAAINTIKQKNSDLDIFDHFRSISKIQYRSMKEMIRPSLLPIWKSCLDEGNKGDHQIKLCGAGGGGFYYLLTRNPQGFKEEFPELSISHIFS